MVFLAVILSSLVGGYLCFRGTCCLHLQFCLEDGDSRFLSNIGMTFLGVVIQKATFGPPADSPYVNIDYFECC
jgi:hypothetical protein